MMHKYNKYIIYIFIYNIHMQEYTNRNICLYEIFSKQYIFKFTFIHSKLILLVALKTFRDNFKYC